MLPDLSSQLYPCGHQRLVDAGDGHVIPDGAIEQVFFCNQIISTFYFSCRLRNHPAGTGCQGFPDGDPGILVYLATLYGLPIFHQYHTAAVNVKGVRTY